MKSFYAHNAIQYHVSNLQYNVFKKLEGNKNLTNKYISYLFAKKRKLREMGLLRKSYSTYRFIHLDLK